MTMLRIAMMIMFIFLGGVGALFGAATTVGMLRSGEVSYTAPENGKVVSRTASRERQPDDFWRVFALLGLLPLIGGTAAAMYGWRAISRP